MGDPQAFLEVSDLKVHFKPPGGFRKRPQGTVRAVDGVDLAIAKGETLGLVGESGCGKSTTGRAILQLLKPTAGAVRLDGIELTALHPAKLRAMRRRMQMIFQDPYGSLSPRMRVGDIVGEPLEIHGLASGRGKRERVADLLRMVGLDTSFVNRYPREFSGGQRQRIGVARALAVEPEFIVADEPVSALDVSIQAQLVNLLRDLQQRLGLTYLFIAHDLSVVRHMSDRVAVMYLGKVVEIGNRFELYQHPLHPYTEALLSAVSVPDPEVERRRQRIVLQGDPPSPAEDLVGCRFRARCWKAQAVCAQVEPPLAEHAPGHFGACHFPAH